MSNRLPCLHNWCGQSSFHEASVIPWCKVSLLGLLRAFLCGVLIWDLSKTDLTIMITAMKQANRGIPMIQKSNPTKVFPSWLCLQGVRSVRTYLEMKPPFSHCFLASVSIGKSNSGRCKISTKTDNSAWTNGCSWSSKTATISWSPSMISRQLCENIIINILWRC